jgi:hypothetical protein
MPRKWEPSPNDAMSLAAFRWFANAIENRAVEMYATDRGTYHHIERILRHALQEMSQTRAQFAVAPPGARVSTSRGAPRRSRLSDAFHASRGGRPMFARSFLDP